MWLVCLAQVQCLDEIDAVMRLVHHKWAALKCPGLNCIHGSIETSLVFSLFLINSVTVSLGQPGGKEEVFRFQLLLTIYRRGKSKVRLYVNFISRSRTSFVL